MPTSTNPSQASATSKFAQDLAHTGDVFMDCASTLASISYEQEFERIASRTEILLANIDAMAQKMIMGANLIADTYTKSIQVGINGIIQGVNESAYAAANNVIDAGAQMKLMKLDQERIDLENQNTVRLRQEQSRATISNLNQDRTLADVRLLGEAIQIGGAMLNDVEILGESAGDAPGEIAKMTAGLMKGAAAANSAMIKSENKLIVQMWDNEKKVSEAKLKSVQEVEKAWIKAGQETAKAWLQFAQALENRLLKSDAAANDMGINLGMSGRQLDEFKTAAYETQIVMSKWGKNMEDMMKMQNAYMEGTGRNVQFTTTDFDKSMAMNYLIGDGTSEQLSASMEVFNHGIADSNDMVYEMYKNVNKIGLNGRKYVKDLLKNLKLAERYEFKGGTKNLMKMSAWAQNVRFNMDSLDSILEKIQGSGLDGIIEQSARLQVLGGGFARGANPFSLMYDAYADPEDLAKTYNDMLEGVGVYNSKTGEVEFGIAEQIKMREFASITGQDYADVKNQRRQQLRGDVVSRELSSGVNWTPDQKALVTNKAQLVDGQWKITMSNGEQKDVSTLTQDDLHHLMPENNDEEITEYVYDIRNMVTKLAEAKEYAQSRLEADGYEQFIAENETRIQNMMTDFETRYDEYLSKFQENMAFATQSQSTMLSIMAQGNTNIDGAADAIKEAGLNVADALDTAATYITDSIAKLTSTDPNSEFNSYKPKEDELTHDYQVIDETRDFPYGSYFSWDNVIDGRSEFHLDNPVHDAVAYNNNVATPIIASQITPIRDGMVAGDGNHMVIPAAKVTPISSTNTITNTQTTKIHDGAIAQADPQDVGVFAKVGGPFDTLFNGVFGRVNDIYDKLNDMGDIGNIITSVDTHNADMRRVGNDTQMLSRNIYNNLNRNIQSDWFDGHTETSQFTPQNIYNHSAHTNNNPAVNNGAVITSVDTHNADMRRVGNDIYNSLSELGTFNPQTGRVEYGIAEQVRLRDFAERTGQDIETVKQQIESRYNTSTDIVERIANQSTAINQILSNGNNDNVQPTHIEPSIPLGSTPTVFATKPTQYNAGNPSQPQQSSSPSSTPSTQTVRLEINGKLELSSNGQQVDIINELRNNPTMVNALMQLIAQQTDRVSGGGRINLASGSSNYSF